MKTYMNDKMLQECLDAIDRMWKKYHAGMGEKAVDKNNKDADHGDTNCESCAYYDFCYAGDDDDEDEDDEAFMVIIADPGNGFDVMEDSAAEENYPDLFPKGKGSKDLTSIPGIKDVYYTFSTQSKRVMDGKRFISSPVMIMKINEEAGEFISPDAMDLYKAARFFEKRKTVIRTNDGRLIPVFCLD